jgi:hypothetical protein
MVRDKSARFVAVWKDSRLQRDQGRTFDMETGDAEKMYAMRRFVCSGWAVSRTRGNAVGLWGWMEQAAVAV